MTHDISLDPLSRRRLQRTIEAQRAAVRAAIRRSMREAVQTTKREAFGMGESANDR